MDVNGGRDFQKSMVGGSKRIVNVVVKKKKEMPVIFWGEDFRMQENGRSHLVAVVGVLASGSDSGAKEEEEVGNAAAGQ